MHTPGGEMEGGNGHLEDFENLKLDGLRLRESKSYTCERVCVCVCMCMCVFVYACA